MGHTVLGAKEDEDVKVVVSIIMRAVGPASLNQNGLHVKNLEGCSEGTNSGERGRGKGERIGTG